MCRYAKTNVSGLTDKLGLLTAPLNSTKDFYGNRTASTFRLSNIRNSYNLGYRRKIKIYFYPNRWLKRVGLTEFTTDIIVSCVQWIIILYYNTG